MAISFADIALNHTDTEHVSLLDDPGVMVSASVYYTGTALIPSLAMWWLLLLCIRAGIHPIS